MLKKFTAVTRLVSGDGVTMAEPVVIPGLQVGTLLCPWPPVTIHWSYMFMYAIIFLNLWTSPLKPIKRKSASVQEMGKYTRREFLWTQTPSSCPLGPPVVAESWREQGVWDTEVVPLWCFLFLPYTITDNESWLPAWISFLSATVLSICWVSFLFSTKLCLGSHSPGSDKFQEKPILIELFLECYANMSKLCGSPFHSKI